MLEPFLQTSERVNLHSLANMLEWLVVVVVYWFFDHICP